MTSGGQYSHSDPRLRPGYVDGLFQPLFPGLRLGDQRRSEPHSPQNRPQSSCPVCPGNSHRSTRPCTPPLGLVHPHPGCRRRTGRLQSDANVCRSAEMSRIREIGHDPRPPTGRTSPPHGPGLGGEGTRFLIPSPRCAPNPLHRIAGWPRRLQGILGIPRHII